MVPHLEQTETTLVVVAAAAVYVWALIKHTKREILSYSLLSLSETAYVASNIELTFAGLHAIRPPVANVSVA